MNIFARHSSGAVILCFDPLFWAVLLDSGVISLVVSKEEE